MVKHSPLTLEFLEQKPLPAGREFAAMKAADAAAFLQTVPTRIAAPVLSAMGAWSAAEVIAKMEATSAAASLQAMNYSDALSILRNISTKNRGGVFDELPEKVRRDFETSLTFPDDTVGAHMVTAVLTLTEAHTVGDAIDLLRRPKKAKLDIIAIVDPARKFVGALTASKLLQYTRDVQLGSIMDQGIAPVSARSAIASLEEISAWQDYSALPVVSRQKLVIGAISRTAVSKLGMLQRRTRVVASNSFSVAMLDTFMASMLGLIRLVADLEASPKPERESQP